MKIYRRPRTWLLVGLLIAIVSLLFFMEWRDRATAIGVSDWRPELETHIRDMQQMLEQEQDGLGEKAVRNIQDSIRESQYALDHNINPFVNTMWQMVSHSANLITVVTLFVIIVTGDLVAGEFAWGTIKLLLIRPASRSKILLAKYAAMLLFALFLLAVLFVTAIGVNGLLYGFGPEQPYLAVSSDGTVTEKSYAALALQTYGLNSISLLLMATFAFMVSTVFRSSTMAIGFSAGLLLGGTMIVAQFAKYSWVNYLLFTHLDLRQSLEGRPIVPGTTIGFSLVVMACYYLLFLAMSWTVFRRRDVAA